MGFFPYTTYYVNYKNWNESFINEICWIFKLALLSKFGKRLSNTDAPRANEVEGHATRTPTTPSLHNLPTLNSQVQVHRMVVKAFASFNGLQQGNEEQSLVEGQPLKNIATKIEFSNHPRQHEVVMEAMITFKASTPLYEGSSMNMLATMLLLNLRTIHGVSNVFMVFLVA